MYPVIHPIWIDPTRNKWAAGVDQMRISATAG